MKRLLFVLFYTCAVFTISEAQIASSFELRYYTKDKEAEGITDFKGGKEFLNTEQRVEFLKVYADVAKVWFIDSALNRKVNEQPEIDRLLAQLKEQPRPVSRNRMMLTTWKQAGIHPNSHDESKNKLPFWNAPEGLDTNNGYLLFNKPGMNIEKSIDTLQWRFYLSWKAMSLNGKIPMSIALKENNRTIAETGFHSNGNIFFTDNGNDRMATSFLPGKWVDFKLEVDLVNDKYNLLIDGIKVGEWCALKSNSMINRISISAGQGIAIDDLVGLKFDTSGCSLRSPYMIEPFLNENFEILPDAKDCFLPEYDDQAWEEGSLPIVRGGALEAGEDLYLRSKIVTGQYEEAWLNIESLDPGGEVWINGNVVFVTHEKHPVKIEISDFLLPHRENTIGIRVYSYYNDGPLYHSPQDRNVGWFCGRAWLDFTEKVTITGVKTFTSKISGNAEQIHKIKLQNNADTTFEGSVIIDYYPWHPKEGKKFASFEVPLRIFALDTAEISYKATLINPRLWTHDSPNLYRVHIKLISNDQIVDDEVITCGIRTVSQEGGILRINGAPELLGGAQTMGFRMPIENIVKWNRCPPASVLADELLACKKMGNTLRIHVHAGGKYAYSVNDPRVAEMADQMGLMLLWPTGSWIREGEWGGIDFEGYPKYMDQVFNHPSIILWEGANHPNKFNDKSLEYSNRFITKMYTTIYQNDSSRLIAPSSYNRHYIYGNDLGSIDQNGNPIVACKEWTAPMIVRGNQDALTGYGEEWHNIRRWPDPYRKSFLDSKERVYINFEHEESIGMQNFSLAKGKPWYQMPSYENNYDVGSIGREFTYDEWQESQAWQAFSAWESMKWQRINDIDGFSWCCLHGGPNSGTYRKPIIDALGHAKLGFYANKMILQDIVAGSNNTDVVYHKKDKVTPVILNIGDKRTVRLKILIKNQEGTLVDTHEFSDVVLEKGRTVKEIPSFKPNLDKEGYYIFEYFVLLP